MGRLHFLAALVVLVVCALGAAPAGSDDSADSGGGLSSEAILAPTFPETRAALDRLDSLVIEAEAVAAALYRVHNRFAELRRTNRRWPGCKSAEVVDLVSRSRVLGIDLRDRVQSTRAEVARVERLMTAPTVQPLVDAATHHRLVGLLSRVEVIERGYMEASAWHSTYLEGVARRCPTRLVAKDGLPGLAVAGAEHTDAGSTAVVGIGRGVICPGEIPAKNVVILKRPLACWSAVKCDCEPAAVLPAAVLGPYPQLP